MDPSGPRPEPTPTPTPSESTTPVASSAAVGHAIWPVTTAPELAGLFADIHAGRGGAFATDPTELSLQFARDVLHWQGAHLGDASTFRANDAETVVLLPELGVDSLDTALVLDLQRVQDATGTSAWLVRKAHSGLIDVRCPSPRQDAIQPEQPVAICGSLTRATEGWRVEATVAPATAALHGTEAESIADIRLSGTRFEGAVIPAPGHAPAGREDVTVAIRLLDAEGAVLGMFAERLHVEPGELELPSAVAETRRRILDAAHARDYDALAALIDEAHFSYSFGESGDPIGYWKEQEAGEFPVIGEYLPTVLDMHPARDGDRYVWPAAATKSPAEWTEQDYSDMHRLYPDEDIRSFEKAGGYLGYRVGIADDGTWLFFVAGD